MSAVNSHHDLYGWSIERCDLHRDQWLHLWLEASTFPSAGESLERVTCMLHGTLGEDSMVKSATRLCQPVMSIPTESSNSTADSLAALSTAFTFGSILLALLAVIVGFAWGKIIAASAKEEAQKAAKERADDWMAQNGPRIIQAHMETLNDAMAGDGNSAAAAAEIGKEA